MGLWLDTRGKSTLGIGICARCSRKFSLDDLQPDGNIPGLMVCAADWDELDPYRLPMRQPENIALPFLRPDEDIGTAPAGAISEDGDLFIITEDGEGYIEP